MRGSGGGRRHGDGVLDRRGSPSSPRRPPWPACFNAASTGVGMRDGPVEAVHGQEQPDERGAPGVGRARPGRGSPRARGGWLSLRDGSRDGQRVRVTRPSTFSSRRSRTPRWRCLSASGLDQAPCRPSPRASVPAWFSTTAPSAPARIRSPAIAPGDRPQLRRPPAATRGVATSTSPSRARSTSTAPPSAISRCPVCGLPDWSSSRRSSRSSAISVTGLTVRRGTSLLG